MVAFSWKTRNFRRQRPTSTSSCSHDQSAEIYQNSELLGDYQQQRWNKQQPHRSLQKAVTAQMSCGTVQQILIQ